MHVGDHRVGFASDVTGRVNDPAVYGHSVAPLPVFVFDVKRREFGGVKRQIGEAALPVVRLKRTKMNVGHFGVTLTDGSECITRDAERLGVDWAQDDESTYYGAQISALTVSPDSDFDAGTLLVTAQAPLTVGQPVSVVMSPASDYVQLNKLAISGPANNYAVTRQHGTNLLHLTGALAPGKRSRQWVSVWEPTQWVANLFEQALAQHGITVLGRRVIGAPTPASATVVVEHSSAPLQELITPLLKLSNNNMSEALLKAMGRKTANAGTAEAGVTAVAAFMRRQGLDPAACVQQLGARIGHVQFADCPGRGAPGSGTLDFAAALQALQTVGYRGWLGAEYRPAAEGFAWLQTWRAGVLPR